MKRLEDLGISPSPWRRDYNSIHSIYSNKEMWCIAEVNHWLPRPDMLANASLIAAAPNLYDSLYRLVAEVNKMLHHDKDGYAVMDGDCSGVELAKLEAERALTKVEKGATNEL